MLSPLDIKETIDIFISYAQEDKREFERLQAHLSPLESSGIIQSLHYSKISPGTEWEQVTKHHIESSDMILLLISADFLKLKDRCKLEWEHAVKRHEIGEAKVIPVILKPVTWEGMIFSRLKPLPTNEKPVTTWTNRDEAFTNISKGVKTLAEGIIEERYSKRLSFYEQELLRVVEHKYPLSSAARNYFLEKQQQLRLRGEDVCNIENPILQRKEAEYKDKLGQYQQELLRVVEHKYPLSSATRNYLLEKQQQLRLRGEDVCNIENPILQRKEAEYKDKLGQYQRELLGVIAHEYPLNDTAENNLLEKQQQLRLRGEDVSRIREPILRQKQTEYQAEYREKLKQYKQFFLSKAQFQGFVGNAECEELRQLQQSLKLLDEDVLETESQVLMKLRLREYCRTLADRCISLKDGCIAWLNSDNARRGMVIGRNVVAVILTISWGVKITSTLFDQQRPTPAQSSVIASPNPLGKQISDLTQQQAKGLIDQWLTAKLKVFGSDYNEQLAAELTTGGYYQSVMERINELREKKLSYEYTPYSIDSLEGFRDYDNKAEIHLKITEDALHEINQDGTRNLIAGKSQIAWGFGLQFVDGKWKILCAEKHVGEKVHLDQLRTCLGVAQ